MKITNIKEGGCNNLLMYSIKQKLPLFKNISLQSLINDEMYYIVTIEDVNFFELFRLTQLYREKLRILEEKIAKIPDKNILKDIYPGDFEIENEQRAPLLELVDHSCQMLHNLVLQMNTDEDIIKKESLRMFLPMLSRNFTIQIPVSFYDIASFCKEEEFHKIFNENYPTTLTSEIIDVEIHSIKHRLMLNFVTCTDVIKYDEVYDKLLNMIKYNSINKTESDKLYKISLLGFFKYDNVNRNEVRCNLFGIDKESMLKKMSSIKSLSSPLKLDFMIQLPIEYIQLLENSFSTEDLPLMYESSINNIIMNGLYENNFVYKEFTEEEKDASEEYVNRIDLYRNRINDANKSVLAAISILMSNDIPSSYAVSILPSIYKANVGIRIDISKKDKYLKIFDDNLKDMFKEIFEIIDSVIEDIQK